MKEFKAYKPVLFLPHMIRIYLIFTTFVAMLCGIISCSNSVRPSSTSSAPKMQVLPKLQAILDSSKVDGAVLIYDLDKDKFSSNNFDLAEKGHLPASTFKIVNSIIALETGVVAGDTSVLHWNGEKRAFQHWEQDLMLKDAFRFSCVPCYREIARKIGTARMNDYLVKLMYKGMDVHAQNLDIFWLEGNSRISCFEQINFLKRFYQSELPISHETENAVKQMMVIEKTDEYKLYAKTGWSTQNGINNGWYVGFVEKGNNVWIFTVNVEPTEQFDMNKFPAIRKEICYAALKTTGILN